ncbi:unnamed protein product [Periconia digitata]|uniref:Nucleolar protein 12 n=1 Tax=Periconia digitata TaxID=1303443 RepID=A0A9W4U941_9PLEO|nr:unnamed protein product [Periconia digitata]
MAKSAHHKSESVAVGDSGQTKKRSSALLNVDKKALDPSLSSLFASSAGPVTAPPKSRYQDALNKHAVEAEDHLEDGDKPLDGASNGVEDEEMASRSGSGSSSDDDDDVTKSESEASPTTFPEKPSKKRKRGEKDEDLEDTYLQKLAREEARDEEKRKKAKTDETTTGAPAEDAAHRDVASESDDDDEAFTIPKHETQLESGDVGAEELEKASRTVFLGNVSSETITSKSAQKQLKQHLSSFIADLADNNPPHKVESIRFRSTAFGSALPKRAAFAKKEIKDTTTKSTNAYAVYSTTTAAREAVKRLNGSIVLNRHLRVDSVAHPAKVDHRRCVFVGNLGFVDDESASVDPEDPAKKKTKPPSDVEEGLWLQFGKAGKVESVRVPRDAQTRVGKGFAYVQFVDETSVEAALLFNEQKYPPLLPRKLRVTRARAQNKKPKSNPNVRRGPPPSSSSKKPASGAYNAKIPAEQKSQQGRARAVLGKAAAYKSAEAFVFEGHRASSRQGNSGLKLGGKGGAGKKKGPNGRKDRSKAWKNKDGKK